MNISELKLQKVIFSFAREDDAQSTPAQHPDTGCAQLAHGASDVEITTFADKRPDLQAPPKKKRRRIQKMQSRQREL